MGTISSSMLQSSQVARPVQATPRRSQRLQVRATQQQRQGKEAMTEYTGPPPKKFGIASGQLLSIATAAFPAAARLLCGGFVSGYTSSYPKSDGGYSVIEVAGRKVYERSTTLSSFARPEKTLILYEFEGCPFCRKVREAICILDLDVLIKPTPRNGPTFRQQLKELGGKTSSPFLVDPNTGVQMYESDDIIKYLFEKYGDGQVPLGLRLGFLTAISAGLGLLPRIGYGSKYKGNGRGPEQPLIYWGYEASPFCKLAREQLSELELPHVYKAAARGSPKRQQLLDKRGAFQVPYLEDPNTGAAMFESSYIVDYLKRTYGLPQSGL